MELTGMAGGIGLIGTLLLALLCILLPLGLFGLKRRIEGVRAEIVRTRETLVGEQRRTNELLGRLLGQAAGAGLAGAPEAEPDQETLRAARRRPLVARRD